MSVVRDTLERLLDADDLTASEAEQLVASMTSGQEDSLVLAALLVLPACSSLGVEPWERDILAKEEMQLVTDPVEAGIDDHIYFSKEASSGGRGFGGGGCGCN